MVKKMYYLLIEGSQIKAWRVLKVLTPQSNFINVKTKLSNCPREVPRRTELPRASLKLLPPTG